MKIILELVDLQYSLQLKLLDQYVLMKSKLVVNMAKITTKMNFYVFSGKNIIL